MKKMTFLGTTFLLILTASCSMNRGKDPKKDVKTVENFVTELKKIEAPASKAFDAFLVSVDTLTSTTTTPSDSAILATFEKLKGYKEELDKASNKFNARALTAQNMPIQDTLAKMLTFSAAYLGQSYAARSAAISNFMQWYSLKDSRLLEGYLFSLGKAKGHATKAFFWITVSRQYASGIEPPTMDTSSAKVDSGAPQETPEN